MAIKYRAEIDGLRAIAVLSVIFFHTGISEFSGGFVGVDIFFVISGYLITSIIFNDLRKDKFSLLDFYERRTRRILPALFLVMTVSSIFAYFWMMPDEFKNFGQSVVATTIFSNNILLAITSNYWALSSEFKPLLHTWSLGVEEQYYIIFPLFMIIGWRFFRKKIIGVLVVITFVSLFVAGWDLLNNKDLNFYLLPTRAWEILLGSLVTFYLNNYSEYKHNLQTKNLLSILGLALIVVSVIAFDHHLPSPSFFTLIPTLGTALIILFASEGTIVKKLLSNRVMVSIGLISYSAYLWHNPVFAFARIYSIKEPSLGVKFTLILVIFFLSYVTWKFIETPCRNKDKIGQKKIFSSMVLLAVFLIYFGYYLNDSYGIPSRIYDKSVIIEDMDKRVYNRKVYKFKKDKFIENGKLKILVIGNSFARDFVNMTSETFDLKKIEIIYRDDFSCGIFPFKNIINRDLFGSANVIVFASGSTEQYLNKDINFARQYGKDIFYIGTKDFGYNLNWVIRLKRSDMHNLYNPLSVKTIKTERDMSDIVPKKNYISLLSPIVKYGQVPITDSLGRMISTDRSHLTKYGAKFIGEKSLLKSHFGEIIINQ